MMSEHAFPPRKWAASIHPGALPWARSTSQTAVDHARDEAQIRATLARLSAAWDQGDGAAYATEFTEDSDYVAFDGSHSKGQFENAELHDELFDTVLRGSRLVGEVESVRFVGNDVAIVHTIGTVLLAWQRKPQPTRLSRATLVLVRHFGVWRVTAFHNTRVRSMPRGGMAVRLFSLYVRLRTWMARR